MSTTHGKICVAVATQASLLHPLSMKRHYCHFLWQMPASKSHSWLCTALQIRKQQLGQGANQLLSHTFPGLLSARCMLDLKNPIETFFFFFHTTVLLQKIFILSSTLPTPADVLVYLSLVIETSLHYYAGITSDQLQKGDS